MHVSLTAKEEKSSSNLSSGAQAAQRVASPVRITAHTAVLAAEWRTKFIQNRNAKQTGTQKHLEGTKLI